MLCPFCLAKVRFKRNKDKNRWLYYCSQAECGSLIPKKYIDDYRRYSPVVVSAVGFRGHGKTVYFSSLFSAFKKKLPLFRGWEEFFTMALNEESLDTVIENVGMLEKGLLPDSTPKNFPHPTMVQLVGLPKHLDCTLLCYDTGGESFEKVSELELHAGFVKRAKTAMFLISIHDLEDPLTQMHKLLNTYVVGMTELGANTKKQHLVVVYTKADRIAGKLEDWKELHKYLTRSPFHGIEDLYTYRREMREISKTLRSFTDKHLRAQEFLSAADSCFKSVEFTMISALGAQPDGQKMNVVPAPRRIVDPVLWLIDKSTPTWMKLFRRWM